MQAIPVQEERGRPVSKSLVVIIILAVLLVGAVIWLAVLNSQAKAAIEQGKSTITGLQGQVSTLQGQVSSANSQITTLKSQAASQQAAFEKQIADLKSILGLSRSSPKVTAMTLNQGPTQLTTVVTFNADYAGYVTVTGTTTTGTAYVRVTSSFQGYPFNTYNYAFGNQGTVLAPVMPGTVTVSIGNYNQSEGATATLTVTYYD